MQSRRSLSFVGCSLAVLAFVAIPVSRAGATGTTNVVYSFGGEEDGEYPSTDLVMDAAGNLYGTSVQGGDFGGGTVFELSPSAGGWTHTVLYSFTGSADGGQPYGGVTLDPAGNLYGTAVVGGSGGTCVEDGCGVAYELTDVGGTWTETVIHNFTGGNDGYGPGSGLTLDTRGNLYGMTPTGGADALGVIYQLTPRATGGWRLRVIHTFTGGKDGATGSAGRLLLDRAGNLFGVATVGGANQKGTAFKLAPTASGWKFNTLYAFRGSPDAGFPYGGLVEDAAGSLYGTTYYDGARGLGSVYELARRHGAWHETVLHNFKGGSDGSNPISTLVLAADGALYGTTSEGGAAGCSCGTIFQLTPGPDGGWTETVAYSFSGAPDAAFAYNGLVSDGAGNFFGATVHGGVGDDGAIYAFTP
jgi:uncharacterized repeat protein (TIGR03803 family)